MVPGREFLQMLRHVTERLGHGVMLDAVARHAGRSRFQAHRDFRRVAGETLKQFTLRLQLERAAARLAQRDVTVRGIARCHGFRSPEVFARAFRRYFGRSPAAYRRVALADATVAQRRRHLALTDATGPAIRFFHRPRYKHFGPRSPIPMTTLSITRQEIAPQHILCIRRRIAPSALQQTLGECFGKLFTHAAKRGLPIAGWPMCRYVSTGLGLWTIEPAVPLAAPATSEGEMRADTLPGGPVAFGIHGGAYDGLPDTNAAIEQWIEENGFEANGPAWESYITDPTKHPDVADWRTEVFWPLKT